MVWQTSRWQNMASAVTTSPGSTCWRINATAAFASLVEPTEDWPSTQPLCWSSKASRCSPRPCLPSVLPRLLPGQRRPAKFARFLLQPEARLDPLGEQAFKRHRVQGQQQFAKRTGLGRTAEVAQGVPDFGRLGVEPLGDGGYPTGSAQHGGDDCGQHGGQRVASAPARTRVGNLLQGLQPTVG